MSLKHTRLLIPALLIVTMLIGSVSAGAPPPPIPSGPYIPKVPEEDIVTVETWVTGPQVWVRVNFAAATPPTGQTIYILITTTQQNPPTETVVSWNSFSAAPVQTYVFFMPQWTQETPSVAVYAWLDTANTDRAPNNGYYPITALSQRTPDVFRDPEFGSPVGGFVEPTRKLEILTPYLALAGLLVAVSAVVVVKKRR